MKKVGTLETTHAAPRCFWRVAFRKQRQTNHIPFTFFCTLSALTLPLISYQREKEEAHKLFNLRIFDDIMTAKYSNE